MYEWAARSERLKCFELVGVDDVTDPAAVLPCGECDAWHVEVYRRDDGGLAVREWHDEHGYARLELLREFEAHSVAGAP
jgi:hypothetical protein